MGDSWETLNSEAAYLCTAICELRAGDKINQDKQAAASYSTRIIP